MDFGTALVAVAAIGAFYSLRSQRTGGSPDGHRHPLGLRRRHGQEPPAAPAQPSPREIELEREVENLRERIHVLERIATDERRPRQLAAEIDSLRDN